MALAEVVAAAPDSAHRILPGDQIRAMGGGFKGDLPQEHNCEDKSSDSAPLKRIDGAAEAVNAGYNIPVLASYDGGMGCDARHVFTGMLADNGQSMYYTPGYEFPQQSTYCSQPQGPYVPNMGSGTTGYCGPQYAPYYQQVSPGLMQYYPTEQEVSKAGAKKLNAKDASQNAKAKPGAPGKLGYQVVPKNSLPDSSNQWGLYQATTNGAFYGSGMSYECYLPQQWHPSTRGFQPIPPPQNIGAQGNCTPLPGGGPGRFQNFPRVHSTPNMSGRILKGSTVKGGTAGSNWRAKDVSKAQSKCDGMVNGTLSEACADSLQKTSSVKSKILQFQEGVEVPAQPPLSHEHQCNSVNRNDYNKDDFQVSYEAAKFFIIKSYSEDDVHKSIKYSVWSSTPNGNKRLDEAYRKAQEKTLESPSTSCPVFFFFSVNCSGQFCGVAEMVGSVDFGKNMDFWLQGKWNGCLPVKWHIIKDVPNGHFRHIILSNNDNKPVTHSRDTQEVHFHQGLEMLKIFKFFPLRTSLLDDFAFYDGRQRVLQERKSRQQLRQQVVKQIRERASEKSNSLGDPKIDSGKENARSVKPVERTSDEATALQNQLMENRGCNGADSVKPKLDGIIYEVAELKLDSNSDSTKAAKSCSPKNESIQSIQDGVIVEQEKASISNGIEDISGGKESSNKSKVAEVVSGGNQNRLREAAVEKVSTAVKEDTSRMVVNYKKALLEGIQGKVIALDQTIGV